MLKYALNSLIIIFNDHYYCAIVREQRLDHILLV